MFDAGTHALREEGIALADIHYDKFTDASTPGYTCCSNLPAVRRFEAAAYRYCRCSRGRV